MDELELLIIDYLQERVVNASCELTSTSPLLRGDVLDSLALTSLVSYLEQSFKIVVPDTEMLPQNFETPNAVAGLVAKLIAERSEAEKSRRQI